MFNRNIAAILLAGALTIGTAPLAFPGSASTGDDNAQQASTATRKQIKKAEGVLKSEGRYSGHIDGTMNPELKTALHQYQIDHHLAATGDLNRRTMKKLGIGGESAEVKRNKRETVTGSVEPTVPTDTTYSDEF